MKHLVMYSGGADSTLLLHKALKTKHEVLALYVNFECKKTNPCQEKNLHFVLTQAEKIGFNLLVETVKPSGKKGPEGNARTEMQRIIKQYRDKFDCIWLGHNKDDHIETVMIQLFRGAGKGSRGIPHVHVDTTYRPLLTMTRDEIRAECNKLGLEYFDDPSNEDTGMTRSFWRNEIIPKLKEHYGVGLYKRIDNISEKFM